MNPTEKTARLLPDAPLPPYSFVPGKFPHPISDPAGHGYGTPERIADELDPRQWHASKTYLFGLDLFNAGYYWESHVEFESLWLASGRRGAVADFLKGLIKLAAAGVKNLEGKPAGVKSHACRAAELFREAACREGPETEDYLGLPLQGMLELAEAVCRHGWPTTPPRLWPSFSTKPAS